MAPRLPATTDLPICTACGTLYPIGAHDPPPEQCRICQDPRQYVPASGQSWTTLQNMRDSGKYKNLWKEEEGWGGKDGEGKARVWSLWTEEKFGIGQRAILVKTPRGLVMWDCITYFDEETIEKITTLGGLHSITISHPHYYTTSPLWASHFSCPLYTSAEDSMWVNHIPGMQAVERRFVERGTESVEILGVRGSGKEGGGGDGVKVTAVKLGGHFEGSLVLVVDFDDGDGGGGGGGGLLFIADTIVTVPSALSPPSTHPLSSPPQTTSYAFMWSIPNMIPLAPATIAHMWKVLKPFAFTSTHGAFVGQDVVLDAVDGRDEGGRLEGGVKRRVLESMKVQVRAEGWGEHEFLAEGL